MEKIFDLHLPDKSGCTCILYTQMGDLTAFEVKQRDGQKNVHWNIDNTICK